jgi:hypothetical protein
LALRLSIQVFFHSGGISIDSNRVDGNLQSRENCPRPTGSGDVVQGNKEDQCRRLQVDRERHNV